MTVERDITLNTPKPAQVSGAAQRLLPQSSRYRWEQQWLSESRGASAAIEGAAHATALARGADSSVQGVDAAAVSPQSNVRATPTTLAPESLTKAVMADVPRAATASSALLVSADVAITPIMVPVTVSREAITPAVQPLPANRIVSAYQPIESRSFALWRHEDEVRVTMRLSTPERDEKSILATLLQWLKQAGLTLRTFTVNGQVRWQNGAADRSREVFSLRGD